MFSGLKVPLVCKAGSKLARPVGRQQAAYTLVRMMSQTCSAPKLYEANQRDAVRDPYIWSKTQTGWAKIGNVGMEMLFDLAKAYERHLIKTKLGIDLPRQS